MKEVLKAIWKLRFEKDIASENDLMKELKNPEVNRALKKLQKDNLVEKTEKGYRLTDKGRKKIKVVACGGVFDILHPGHAFILEKSKEYGDVLVVIVAKDLTVMKRKRIPIVPEGQRVEMVRHLKPVDVAILGKEDDFLKVVEEIKPDVIALGPDQHHDAGYIQTELRKRGLGVEVVRIKEYKECALHSTRSILQKIIERNYPDLRSKHQGN
jgi:FAD synthetase